MTKDSTAMLWFRKTGPIFFPYSAFLFLPLALSAFTLQIDRAEKLSKKPTWWNQIEVLYLSLKVSLSVRQKRFLSYVWKPTFKIVDFEISKPEDLVFFTLFWSDPVCLDDIPTKVNQDTRESWLKTLLIAFVWHWKKITKLMEIHHLWKY